MNRNINKLFQYMCKNGHLEYAQHILQFHPTFDISANNERAFRMACEQGHLEVVQWLYKIKPTINISKWNEHAFRWACENGHLEVAQWLYLSKPTLDISADNEEAFICACGYGHLEVAQWIQSLNPTKYIILNVVKQDNYKHILYKIVKTFNKRNTVLHMDYLEICPICIESSCDIQTSCNHTFCESCIQIWINSNKNTCPYCRTCLENTVFQPIATH